MFNLAVGFTWLLSFLLLACKLPLSLNGFVGLIVVAYLALRVTNAGRYLRPGKLVHLMFGMASMLIIGGFVFIAFGMQFGADVIGVAIASWTWFIPTLLLLVVGSMVLLVQSIHHVKQQAGAAAK